jgi:hypothetical protein
MVAAEQINLLLVQEIERCRGDPVGLVNRSGY